MKIVTQNFKTGKLSVSDAPTPSVKSGGILVDVSASLISVGTERAVIGLSKKNYLGKALDRPDLARQVINKAKTDGLWETYKVVQNLISEPLPLGYSLVGRVSAVGGQINEVSAGDRVACAGLGYANHAENVYIPKNLFVPVPDNVSDDQAAYVTLGVIAMHGVRQADQQVGANILVVGLGLVGQITAQISKASGHRVIGLDFDQRKNKLAKDNGIIDAFNPEDPDLISKIMNLTEGRGVDAVLLTAASKNSGQVFDKVSDLCRDRAKIVVVGEVKMDMTRRYFFNKELEILQSRSYGPGRYDTNYEEKGQDYPVGYVRWTERRNMESFIDLLSRKLVSVDHLTTHSFDFDEAEKAYELLEKPPKDDLLIGVLLKYKEKNDTVEKLPASVKRTNKDTLNLGVIGTGRFARGILLPAFNENKKFRLAAVSSASGLSAQSVADKFASDVVTSDTSAILKDPNIDAVVIATRPDLHAKFVIEALKENKHVYVEKPLCLTYDELSEIQQTYSNSDTILTVGFNRRFSPLITKMKTHFEGRQEPLTMMYRVNAGRINLNAPEGWVHDPAIGGGRIISEACHFIDTMSAICGAKVTEIHSMATNPRRDDLAGNDNVTLTCRFDDGSIGTVHYFSNGDKSMAKEYLEVFGEEKIAVLDNYRTLRLVRNNRSKVHRSLKLEKGFKEEIEGFYKAIASGKNPIDIDSIYATTHMTIQATEQVQGSGI